MVLIEGPICANMWADMSGLKGEGSAAEIEGEVEAEAGERCVVPLLKLLKEPAPF